MSLKIQLLGILLIMNVENKKTRFHLLKYRKISNEVYEVNGDKDLSFFNKGINKLLLIQN